MFNQNVLSLKKCNLNLADKLIGLSFDKARETIDIAKKIGTFETSIEPFEDCCTVFLPENPIVKPDLQKTLKEQSKIDFDAIIDRAMESIEVVEINHD